MLAYRFAKSICFAVAALCLVSGCTKKPNPPQFQISEQDVEELPERIDAIVDHTLNSRTLNTNTHNAWQIVHGILPYGYEFKIEHEGQKIPALEWILAGNKLNGWDLRPGEKGVYAMLVPGSNAAQGHPDQWIGYLSQCGVKPEDKIVVQGNEYKFSDMVEQAKWDIKPGMEASWTLMALSTWEPLNVEWESSEGEKWNLERVAAMEAVPIDEVSGENSSCGGTHRLSGLTIALNRYMKETGTPPEKLTGGWKKVYDLLYGKDGCVARARAYQQPDGSFSTNFFTRPGSSPEIDSTLHSTGHTLEWLTVALTPEQLKEPWITAAVLRLCDLLEENAERDLDCGGLYHAARGLKLYREARFGPPTKQESPEAETAPKADDNPPAPPSTADGPPAPPGS